MADPKAMMSTQEFARKAGVSPSTVSKWLRTGKIKGTKQGRKWLISIDQLDQTGASQSNTDASKSAALSQPAKPAGTSSSAKTYTIETFSEITYLTPFGVERYIKEGRLATTQDAAGKTVIAASNLENPNIQRLLRK